MTRLSVKQPICHLETVQKNRLRGEASDEYFANLSDLPEDVYRRVTACLIRIAEKVGVPRDQCEDVAQEAWLEAAQNLDRFRGEHGLWRLRSWLAKVAHSRAVDARDKLERESMRSLDALPAEPRDRKTAQPSDEAEWSEWLTALLERLRREEPENCLLVCRHRLEGRSIQELAEETGWNANEIRCRIYRGMQRMRSWASEFRANVEESS